jgi:hypothetical protein
MNEVKSSSLQISFLPWAEIQKNIRLGPITFWPYYTEASQRIGNLEIKTHLDKYFRSYVDYQGDPVDTITVCSHGNDDFRNLSDSEYRDLRTAVDILIFVAIAPQVRNGVRANNKSWGPPSGDVFELVSQNFNLKDDDITVKAGSLLSGGWRIGEITFPKPWAIGGGVWRYEEELIQGLDKCFSAGFPVDVRERLFRSLEWFRMAHIEGGQVSELSKVVMMATGFEILLQFPREGKRRHFVDYMEKHVASNEFHKDNRTTDKEKTFFLSLAGCWAWDFYELRNHIVHGDSIPLKSLIYRDWITHLIVADLVFLECMKRVLFDQKCIGNNVRSCAKEFAKSKEPNNGSIEPLARWFLGFNDVHRALGWIPKKGAPKSR